MLSKEIEAIIKSYNELGLINYDEAQVVPARADVFKLVTLIKNIVFPGFFEKEHLGPDVLGRVTGEKLQTLLSVATELITKSMCWDQQQKGGEHHHEECQQKAISVSTALIQYLPQLRDTLSRDAQATYDGDPAAKSVSEVILGYPGFQATFMYRIAHFLLKKDVSLIPRLITEISHGQTGIDIHPGATIGESFCIDHGTGVVIGETAIIGHHVKLYQGVTIGALSVPKKECTLKRHPTIEDHVTVYARTTILGGDTVIGHDSTIGGNLWLIKSIPPYSKVYSSPENYTIKTRES